MGLILTHVRANLQAIILGLIRNNGQQIVLRNGSTVKPAQKLYLDVNLGYSAVIPVDNQNIEAGQIRAKLYGPLDAQIEADDQFQVNDTFYKVIGVLTPHDLWKEALVYAIQ